MYSKAQIKGHPIHPLLVAFPITFYTTSLIAFIIYRFSDASLFVFQLAYFCNYAGIATALLAAVPGFIDWAFGIPKTSAAKGRGLTHMILNVSALILFAINAAKLNGTWDTPPADITNFLFLPFIGVLLTLAAGYHGWELIATHKVGVTMTPQQEILEPVEKYERRDHKIDTRQRHA